MWSFYSRTMAGFFAVDNSLGLVQLVERETEEQSHRNSFMDGDILKPERDGQDNHTDKSWGSHQLIFIIFKCFYRSKLSSKQNFKIMEISC